FLSDTVGEEIQNDEILRRFSLERLKNRNPFDLSGGEAQRLALAKIEQTDADIFLLDEPTKGTDAVFRRQLAEILHSWCRQGKTIILSTHDLEFAGRYADNAAFLFNGHIVSSAPRRRFFSALDIYTTALSALTDGRMVCVDDAEVSNEA
uniref:ATP-binding cassette domain-containing protein n=1 Tax=Eubacterium sp. TaxID=142586 RepID=UPI0040264CB3